MNTWFKAICLAILLLQPITGWSQDTPPVAEEAAQALWQPPDVAALPDDWWPKFIAENSVALNLRAEALNASVAERLKGLDAESLVSAQAMVQTMQTNLGTVLSLTESTPGLRIDPLPTLETYTIEQLLDLRGRWRNGRSRLDLLALEQQQFDKQSRFIAQRSDRVLAQYQEADPSSPQRLLAGLQRINLQLELYSMQKRLEANAAQQKQLQAFIADANQRLGYASGHLHDESLSLDELDAGIQSLTDQVAATSPKLAAVQRSLLDAVNAEQHDTYKILNLKQQLTWYSARHLLDQVKLELAYTKRDWLLLNSDGAEAARDLRKRDLVMSALLNEASQQSYLWTQASQNTLVNPAPEKGRQAQRAYAEAQESAHQTLDLIDEINATLDNLTLLRERVTDASLKLTSGFDGAWLRVKLTTLELAEDTVALMDVSLFHVGERPVTTGHIIKAILVFFLFWALSWLIRHLLDRLERRQRFQQGSFYASGRVLHYIILTIAFVTALGSIGLNFRNFALIAGALSVGIGFGLQSVVLNFVSGLILLFEGSIRVGDYVELDSKEAGVKLMGIVKEIRSRATLINTNDNVDVIVPNSELVGNRMINWTLKESIARMRIPFTVAYGTDKELVQKAAIEAALQGEHVIQHMPSNRPAVRLLDFGDNALHFELRVWVNRQGVRRPMFVRSSILWALDTKFREYGIRVPFPQRDLHIIDGNKQRLVPGVEPEDAPAR